MNISMDPSQLKTIAAKIISDATSYKSYIVNVYKIVDAMGSSWAGKDSQEYIKKVNSYKKDMENIGKIIEQYGNFLKTTAANYEKTQNEIKSVFSK